MQRFLILSFCLFASLFIYSSSSFAAVTYDGSSGSFSCGSFYGACSDVQQTTYTRYQNEGADALTRCRSDHPDMFCFYSTKPYSNIVSSSSVHGGYTVQYSPDNVCTAGTVFNPDTGECVEPVCESPNYIDVVSGECLPPEEVCYTDLANLTEQCSLIPELEEDPKLNCVTDESGKTLCLDDNPLCFTIDGVTACPESDSVCGWKNGTYNCINQAGEGCIYFNGEKVCATPDGDIVDSDSPDHPDNGGNLDGNDTNDPTDPRDPTTEGGDPTNQPDSGTTDASTEKTSKLSLAQLQDLSKSGKASAKALEKMASEGVKTNLEEELTQGAADAIIQNGASGSWDDPSTGTWATVDGHADSIGSGGGQDYGIDMITGIGTTTKNLIPQGTCQNLGFTFKGHVFGLPCDKTKKIRDLMSWVFYLLTAWFLFDIITSPATRQK